MEIYLAGYLVPLELVAVVVIGIVALVATIYGIRAGVPCPDWLKRLIEANANIYRAIPLPVFPVLVVLFLGWLAVSAAVLSLAVMGGTYIMDDPNYPAVLEGAPWFEWVMFTSIELFLLGIRVVLFTVLGSLLLAAYHWVSRSKEEPDTPAGKLPSNANVMSEESLKRMNDLMAITSEYKGLALDLGGVLKSAKKENTQDWMKYRDEVIAEAEEAFTHLEDCLLDARGMNAAIDIVNQHNIK